MESDPSQTHRSPLWGAVMMPHQTSHYFGWLLWLTDTGWILDDYQGPGWQRRHLLLITAVRDDRSGRRADGQWLPPLPRHIQLSLWSQRHQYATSKPLGEVRVACVCLCDQCVCVWLITHLCPLSEPWPFSPFVCRVREETRGPSRHEITDYTLNASPRGLSGVQESNIGRRERVGGVGGAKREKNKQRGWNGVNCKSRNRTEETPGDERVFVLQSVSGRDGGEKRDEGDRAADRCCASLSGWQSDFYCPAAFSAQMMTAANLR